MIKITRKQAEDMITLIEKNTSISKGVVIGFLRTELEKPVEVEPYVCQPKPDFPNSDRV